MQSEATWNKTKWEQEGKKKKDKARIKKKKKLLIKAHAWKNNNWDESGQKKKRKIKKIKAIKRKPERVEVSASSTKIKSNQ